MKACKNGLKRACSCGQHILDKHDQDIRYAVIGQHALYKHDHDTQMFLSLVLKKKQNIILKFVTNDVS